MNELTRKMKFIVDDSKCITERALRDAIFDEYDNKAVSESMKELVDSGYALRGRNMLGKTLVSNK